MPQLPPLTKALMLICTVVFCVQSLIGVRFDAWFALQPFGSTPFSFRSFMPWQVLTYAFLHGDAVHLLFNMLGLWMFGAEIESRWGKTKFWHYLLACTLSAAAVQMLVMYLLGSRSATLGASGALYGLLLAYVFVFPNRRFDLVGFLPMVLMTLPGQFFYMIGMVLLVMLFTNRAAVPIPPMPVSSKVMVLLFGGMELFQSVVFGNSGVAHFAHLGGMLGGWLMFRYWQGQAPFPKRRRF